MDGCKPLLGPILEGLEGLGYRLARAGPEGMLLYSPRAPGAPAVASLDPPHAVVGWKAGRGYRVFSSPRSRLPGSYEACILSPSMDRVEGLGRVDGGLLALSSGRASMWSLVVPVGYMDWPSRILSVASRLHPRLLVLVRWHGGPRPCSAAGLLAGYVPLVDMLPGGGCGWPRPPLPLGVVVGF